MTALRPRHVRALSRACEATPHGCVSLRTLAGRPCCPSCTHRIESKVSTS